LSLAGVFAAADVLVFVIVNIVIVICRLLLDEGIVIILYSLTKYSAVFLKEKMYFEIFCNRNNQLGLDLAIVVDKAICMADMTNELDMAEDRD
jgi:hypothetical protein